MIQIVWAAWNNMLKINAKRIAYIMLASILRECAQNLFRYYELALEIKRNVEMEEDWINELNKLRLKFKIDLT
ncbi:unnamed protein product [Blepharisma stoltei]|uniref:Uncharacterized protein n=1 Tax=Blepharisma stoltei TaxID=1481888 RepID=A0AAU9JJP7_9CILI|nr:unnamed protein product [Blepharisma stoltei]